MTSLYWIFATTRLNCLPRVGFYLAGARHSYDYLEYLFLSTKGIMQNYNFSLDFLHWIYSKLLSLISVKVPIRFSRSQLPLFILTYSANYLYVYILMWACGYVQRTSIRLYKLSYLMRFLMDPSFSL